jgi:hypothetical protein
MMTFLPESSRAALDSFGPVSAVLVALLAALVVTGFWEHVLQEIRLKRVEQKRRAADNANQRISIYPADRHGNLREIAE